MVLTRTASAEHKKPTVCVFCGSSPGKSPVHLEAARSLGQNLSAAGYNLVYGGGTLGIMGEMAKTMVSNAGAQSVTGIIPRALVRTERDNSLRNDEPNGHEYAKQAEKTVTENELQRIDSNEEDHDIIPASEYGRTIVVKDMHTRKHMMAQQVISGGAGSGFVALAGGYGTIEEVMEMVTWNQLNIHHMPIVLVNINGYWDGLLDWVKNSINEGFVAPGNANILVEVKSTSEVVEALRKYQVPEGRFKLDWSR